MRPVFFGFDENPTVLNEAKRNAQEAQLSGFIHFGRQTLEHLHRPHELEQPGLLITNPPYGERMGVDEDVIALYRLLGDKLKTEFRGWRAGIIAADEAHGHALGLRADKR